jgi:nucleolar protein 9
VPSFINFFELRRIEVVFLFWLRHPLTREETMPPRKKEERRRGKKRKTTDPAVKTENDDATFYIDREGDKKPDPSTPAWLIEDKDASTSHRHAEPSTPFGLVDLELKAYLRSAHIKLNELMETALEESRTISQDEEVKTLRNAMLDEIKGKEFTLATDSDTSRILEDMLQAFSERQTRILADSLTGSSEDLFRLSCHRFGSHLLQSTLLALQSAASQEEKENLGEKKRNGDGKELRSAQQLVLDISKELHLHTSEMLPDQFGTHVLRTLLLVLSGQASNAALQNQRSKKSRSFQEKTQSTRLVKEEETSKHFIPPSFKESLKGILESIKGGLDASQMKGLSTDAVAGPTLTLFVELSLSMSDQNAKGLDQDSLLTVILDGLVASESPQRSDYLESLMKDSVGSHMLQRLVSLVDEEVIGRLWQVYSKGSLCKLGVHPIANFVIAAIVRRLGEKDDAFGQACKEIEKAGDSLLKHQKLGILVALADRSLELSRLHPFVEVAPNEVRQYKKKEQNVWTDDSVQSKAARAILSAFGFSQQDESEGSGEDGAKGLLINTLASGKTKKSYRKEVKRMREKAKERTVEEESAKEAVDEVKEETNAQTKEELLVSMQGSLLCQSLLRLPEPGNTPLIDSILTLPSLLPLSTNPISVHIILAPFQENASTAFAQRISLSTKILSELSPMLSDKFASRAIDCVFDKSDAFFKEKIMRRCIEEENTILTTNFGRYFLKRVNISLFRKDVGMWKRQMKDRKLKNEEKKEEAVAVKQSLERPNKKAKVDQELDLILAGI